jgi:dTDP-4-dehydrorhamnose reductase
VSPTLVTGSSGQLGSAFRRLLGDEAVFPTRDELDLARPGDVEAVFDAMRPSLVLNCAAYTAVDRAEGEPDVAAAVNAVAVESMAEWCRANGAKLVTFSTDYVFDGSKPEPYVESDPTAPINVYGATKLDWELRALDADPTALIVRTSWVLSGTHPNFASTMLTLARQRPLQVVNDQRGRPTLVDDLAPAVLRAVAAGASGILHLTNQGAVTWYDLARIVLEMAGLDPDTVTPCITADYPRPAARPANSVLDSERLVAYGLDPLPDFRPGLERAVAALEAVR